MFSISCDVLRWDIFELLILINVSTPKNFGHAKIIGLTKLRVVLKTSFRLLLNGLQQKILTLCFDCVSIKVMCFLIFGKTLGWMGPYRPKINFFGFFDIE